VDLAPSGMNSTVFREIDFKIIGNILETDHRKLLAKLLEKVNC